MEEVKTYLLPIAIGVIMFGIGLNLTFADFKRVFIEPKAILIGLIGQLVLLPVVAFVIVFVFDLKPVYQIGLVLIAACPGGTSSNIITYMLKGRLALSIALTSINSFIILLTIPSVLFLAYELFFEEGQRISLSVTMIIKELSLTIVLPVILGIIINEKWSANLEKLKSFLRYFLPILLFAVFLVILLQEKDNDATSLNDYTSLIIPLLILNLVVMIVGYYISGILGVQHTGKYTIAIELGLQNTALAIFIATTILSNNEIAFLAVIYGSFSFFSTFLIAYLLRQFGK